MKFYGASDFSGNELCNIILEKKVPSQTGEGGLFYDTASSQPVVVTVSGLRKITLDSPEDGSYTRKVKNGVGVWEKTFSDPIVVEKNVSTLLIKQNREIFGYPNELMKSVLIIENENANNVYHCVYFREDNDKFVYTFASANKEIDFSVSKNFNSDGQMTISIKG